LKLKQKHGRANHSSNPNELELPKDSVDKAIALYSEILTMLINRNDVDKETLTKFFTDRSGHESATMNSIMI